MEVVQMSKAKMGIWTPWALVLCYECHGPKFPRHRVNDDGEFERYEHTLSEFEWKRNTTPLAIEEGKAITYCDKCGQAIQTYDSVAEEHNLVKALRDFGVDASMDQTGGMNSACTIRKDFQGPLQVYGDYPKYMVVYNIDGDNVFYFEEYDEDDEWIEASSKSFEELDDVVKHVLELEDVAKITEGK
jgi:hypothetical protein